MDRTLPARHSRRNTRAGRPRSAAPPGDRVRGEEDARTLGVDHSLHDHREAEAARRDIVRLAVRDSAVVPERCPAFAHRVEDRVLATHAKYGVLLAREARIGEV